MRVTPAPGMRWQSRAYYIYDIVLFLCMQITKDLDEYLTMSMISG